MILVLILVLILSIFDFDNTAILQREIPSWLRSNVCDGTRRERAFVSLLGAMHSDTASTSTLATTPTPSAHSSSTASQTVATTEPWWQTLAKELDERHLRKEYAEIHRLLEEATAREPHNIELLWRLARSYFDLGNGSSCARTPSIPPDG